MESMIIGSGDINDRPDPDHLLTMSTCGLAVEGLCLIITINSQLVCMAM